MKFIEIRFSPEAKHAYKWLQPYLIAALTAAPTAYDQLGAVQEYVSPGLFKVAMWVLGVLTLVNHLRAKPEKKK